MHTNRRAGWEKLLKNADGNGNNKALVFADASHGTFDSRLVYGRALVKPQSVEPVDERTLEDVVRSEMEKGLPAVAASAPLIAKRSKQDSLGKLQKNMKVVLKKKKKRKAGSGLATSVQNASKKKGKQLSAEIPAKKESKNQATKQSGSEPALSALQGLVGSYGSDSDE